MVADFTAINDPYGVVRNVNDFSVLPVGRVDVHGLFAAALCRQFPWLSALYHSIWSHREALKILF